MRESLSDLDHLVGTATGIPLGTAAYYYEDGGQALYAIVASGTGSVRVQERS